MATEDALPTLPQRPEVARELTDHSLDEKLDEKHDGSIKKEAFDPETFDSVPDRERVVTTGRDVSHYVVDLRDDGDPALTFRSLVLGTVIAGLGAALCQIYIFKPVTVSVSSVFLLLLIYSIGNAWAAFLPKRSLVKGTRFERLGGVIDFINPGPFRIKEHVVATLVASTAAGGATSVNNFAVQRLYYDTNVGALTAIFATFSTLCFGMGLVGILRPLTVYPSEMVYWQSLPQVTVFQALHFNQHDNTKRVRLFWIGFAVMFAYEVIPAYIFPLLNSVSIFCLSSQHASTATRNIFTNIFGGGNANEGLGLLNFSFDWQYLGSHYMALPLTQQANAWIGYALCYIIIAAIYYSNAWDSKNYKMLSTSIFNSNGTVYNQAAVFGSNGVLNETALEEFGLPAMTGSNAWSNFAQNLGIGALIAHVTLFWSGDMVDAIRSFRADNKKQNDDPHFIAMQKYKEAPWYWYFALLVLAFVAGLIVCIKGETSLPWWSFIVSLAVGAFITPFSTILYGRMGTGIATNNLMKMIPGALNPGKPVANLYFSMWSHDVVATSIGLAADLKTGQYTKVPPRVMFLTQLWGCILGAIVNYVVMVSIVDSQREVLLDASGTNVWSGQTIQSLNSQAVTWSLAHQLYSHSGPYVIVPLGLAIGLFPPIVQWLLSKRWPVIKGVKVESVILPIIFNYAQTMSKGITSYVSTGICIGLVSQLWLRQYHPVWYRKYNFILGGAFDGGAQVMIFILSFAVFGASGTERPFPTWAGNPAQGNIDYCNGNGVLSAKK
ncbi:peptide transporter MTD1 [Schizophyllum commune Tattone D]|nr:peptide transporter MTD1 [Schizophyllum commune Tattone D]